METIKSYTDLQQSKKLAEFLPLESADMYWWSSGKRYYIEAMDDGDFNEEEGHVRAWSLAALIDVFEDKGFFYKLYFDGVSNVLEVVNIDNPNIHEMNYNDYPVDACVEMILRLNELICCEYERIINKRKGKTL